MTLLGRDVTRKRDRHGVADGGQLLIEPETVDLGGPAFLDSAASALARSLVTIREDVPGVPEGMALTDVKVTDAGFAASLSGTDVTIGRRQRGASGVRRGDPDEDHAVPVEEDLADGREVVGDRTCGPVGKDPPLPARPRGGGALARGLLDEGALLRQPGGVPERHPGVAALDVPGPCE